jgi:hypothetical protein
MGALEGALNVATCVLSGNNREQIHPLAVGAGQVEENVLLCRNCRHARVPLARLSSVAFHPVYYKE